MSWQKILAQGFTSAKDLLTFLELPLSLDSQLAEKQFSTRVPLSFAQRMQKGNPKDPLLLQVLALEEELVHKEGYTTNPLEEISRIPIKGLIHKYHGRVLLTLTGVCAVNCRFCFRRHFPYQENNPGRIGWNKICEYIAQDSSIKEVILSGGDPLLASDHTLSALIQELELIPHVNTLRIHTRIPVVFPERIDAHLLALLSATRLRKVIVLHCNHAQELNDQVGAVCDSLHKAGCTLLNQSVLLANINDNVASLVALSEQLFAFKVIPYYLHLLDKVAGAAHFDSTFEQAQQLYKQMQNLLPGYLLPRLVRDEPGKQCKTILI